MGKKKLKGNLPAALQLGARRAQSTRTRKAQHLSNTSVKRRMAEKSHQQEAAGETF